MSKHGKVGILMLNMGGPKSANEVQPFLTRLFTDRDIIKLPFQHLLGPWIAKRRTPDIVEKYGQIGGGSPIFDWTVKQGNLMCTMLNDRLNSEHKAYVGFRYASPLTHEALDAMHSDGIKRCVCFSQYPHYSCTTSGSSLTAIAQYYLENKNIQPMEFSFIERWCTHPKLIETFAENISSTLEREFPDPKVRDNVVILFSAHSVPLYVMNRGDTYPSEVSTSVELVMDKLKRSNPHRLVWQSKVGFLPWLKPDTENSIKALVKRGQRNLLLVPIAFVNEHIETLHEMDIEYAEELGEKVGAEKIVRCPSPNDSATFIESLADIVQSHLESNIKASPQLLMRCIHCTNENCGKTKAWIRKVVNV